MTGLDLPDTAVPPIFRNYDEAAAWRSACQRARERFGEQTLRVAPGCAFKAAFDDVPLREGDVVRPFEHFTPAQIEELLAREVVLRGTPGGELVELCPPDARFVAARSIIAASGAMLLPGAEVHAFLLRRGQADLDQLVASGAVVDRKPQPPQASSPADRALADALASLARAESDLTEAESAWTESDTATAAKTVRSAEDAVKRAELLVTRARTQKDAADAAAKAEHRTRLIEKLDAIKIERDAAKATAEQRQLQVEQAAVALARALGASRQAADEEYAQHVRWGAVYAGLSGVPVHQVRLPGLPIPPDLRKAFGAIAGVTGVEAHLLFEESQK